MKDKDGYDDEIDDMGDNSPPRQEEQVIYKSQDRRRTLNDDLNSAINSKSQVNKQPDLKHLNKKSETNEENVDDAEMIPKKQKMIDIHTKISSRNKTHPEGNEWPS